MMQKFLRSSALALVASAAYITTPSPAKAYQVDCAILLCLSGGWPASAECVHARAVFIRRITPWPIEPPLQIWRCPMGIAARDITSPSQQLLDFAFKDAPPVMQSYPDDDYYFDTVGKNRYNNPQDVSAPDDVSSEALTMADLRTDDGELDALKFLYLTQEERADIDISGPEFDFVRSIVVWDIRSFSHRERGRDDDCSIQYYGLKGTYGQQGEFSYHRADLNEVPTWVIPQRSCRPASQRRGVGVEWRSYQNEYGNEWVPY